VGDARAGKSSLVNVETSVVLGELRGRWAEPGELTWDLWRANKSGAGTVQHIVQRLPNGGSKVQGFKSSREKQFDRTSTFREFSKCRNVRLRRSGSNTCFKNPQDAGYLRWVFEAKKRFGLSMLNYVVTSNHIHLLMKDRGAEVILNSMQLIAGRTAQRQGRQGAFWEDRYHARLIILGLPA
jgi:hypothetical protein